MCLAEDKLLADPHSLAERDAATAARRGIHGRFPQKRRLYL